MAAAVTGCFHPTADSAPFIVVTYQGGLCSENSVCEETFTVYEDGVFEGARAGKLSDSEISKLHSLMDAIDFGTLSTKLSLNPTCASFHDGTDVIVAVQPNFSEEYRTCLFEEVEFFTYVNSLSF